MFKYIRLILTAGPHILFCFFKWMLKYSRHPDRYPFLERYAAVRELCIHTMKRFRINLQITGIEYLNRGPRPLVMVSNHTSMMDIVCLLSISENPLCFIAKDDVKKFPFVGRCLRALDGGFLDRDDLRQNVAVMARAEKRINAEKISYMIYPEGHRSKDPEHTLQEFHPGSFKLAYRSKAPLLYFASYGCFRPFSTKINYKSYLIQFRFFPIMGSEEYLKMNTTELAPFVHDKIQQALLEMKKVDDEYMSKERYKQYPPLPNWWNSYLGEHE